MNFNPLPPYGGRLVAVNDDFSAQLNFNPLPPYGGRLLNPACHTAQGRISIHSLRMEGDQARPARSCQALHFNPLPPYGGRPDFLRHSDRLFRFQSTPSVWRETGSHLAWCRYNPHFNPLPPYGGRPHPVVVVRVFSVISIHSLRMEGDVSSPPSLGVDSYFNPLPPYGGRHQR